jgi:hypothetical protein
MKAHLFAYYPIYLLLFAVACILGALALSPVGF